MEKDTNTIMVVGRRWKGFAPWIFSADCVQGDHCLENLEMSGNLIAVREMSRNLIKVRELSGKKSCQGKCVLHC